MSQYPEKSLDKTDIKILEILQTNAKITNSQLAKEIGLSPAPTLERVKKLETSGVIKSYHAKVDTDKLGIGIQVFIQASLTGSNRGLFDRFIEKVQKIPEIIECHHVTGSSDFLLKILIRDIKAYNDFILEKMIGIEEIGNVQSLMVLSTLKDSKVMPIQEGS